MPLIAIHHSVFFTVTRSCGMLYDNSVCHQKKRLITDYLTQSGTEAQNMVWKCSCNNTELCNRSSNRLNFNLGVVFFTLGQVRQNKSSENVMIYSCNNYCDHKSLTWRSAIEPYQKGNETNNKLCLSLHRQNSRVLYFIKVLSLCSNRKQSALLLLFSRIILNEILTHS